MKARWRGGLFGTIATTALAGLALAGEPPAGRDPRPPLKRHCLRCHSAPAPKAGLRLDRPLDRAAIEKIVAALRYDGPVKMPPDGKLPDDERQALERALLRTPSRPGESGGVHWAFRPLVRPSAPTAGNPIDFFLQAKLRAKGLRLSPEADRPTLLRRLAFDLTGLPPTPEEIQAFVADPRPDAYPRQVDRLLASPRYGERWARHWLDVVRFAESNGFEMNQTRSNAWPYRDWVIRAFNDDMPYDRFVAAQLAGDALGMDEATGFLVGGPWDQVKSPDPVLTAQQRADELNDMVSTAGTAFLGLTVGCARCHNHKFDPIPTTDYYALKAVFSGVQHGERPLPDKETSRARSLAALQAERATVLSELAAFQPLARTEPVLVVDDTPAQKGPDAPAVEEIVPAAGVEPHASGNARGQIDFPGDGRALPNIARGYHWWSALADRIVFAYAPKVAGRWRLWLSWGCGWSSHARDARYVLDGDGDPATTADQSEIARIDQRLFADGTGDPPPNTPLWSGLKDAGVHDFTPATRLLVKAGAVTAPVTADLIVLTPPEGAPTLRPAVTSRENVERFAPVVARFVRFAIQETAGGAEPGLDELEVFSGAQEVALAARGARVTVSGTLPGYAIHRTEHLIDGRPGNEHSWISDRPGVGWAQIELPQALPIERVAWGRDRDGVFADRVPVRYTVQVSLDGHAWRTVASSSDRLPYGSPAPDGAQFPAPTLPAAAASRRGELRARQARLDRQIARLAAPARAYAGTFTAPEKTFLLFRGDPMQPREPAAPGGLSAFAGFRLADDAPEQARRLALARWIVAPQNPLTARVIANRLWQHHFGRGLVDTPSDFGRNGAPPTHPELLDYLATELIARRWSLKALHRQIVLSAAYRQSGAARPQARAIDADTRLLWRYPPQRLEAEALRDTILQVSGKLDLAMGGPGFDLFEPNANYVKVYQSRARPGPDTWRRMIYQSKPRMQLDNVFGVFDCPDAGQVTPQRSRSTTPLQALNLLNSPFLLEQAGFFAERIRREAGPLPPRQVERAFRLAFGRPPARDEASAAQRLTGRYGLGALCRALFNANEFLTVP